jgi:exosortase J
MSAFPDSEIHVQAVRRTALSPAQFAAAATTLAVLGLSVIWPAMQALWALWTTDALKSIGMVVPLVSLVLILRAWRGLGWQANGTGWGLALLLIPIAAVRLQQQAVLVLVVSPQWSTILPPPSLVLLAYGAGVVLLIGGVRLFRAALFPILLLWFANPVPHLFTSLVDLPLQHASAHVARAFAMSLGHTLTPDHLRLMFTPDFGMFIAPGCDGIRGSVTMGFIALIAGYVYRFRWSANALVVLGAVLLGYVFNLVRLCMLVLYYAVALHFPSLQDKAENADYVIGAVLFLSATLLLLAVVQRLRGPEIPPAVPAPGAPTNPAPRFRYAQLAAMGAIVILGFTGLARAYTAVHPSTLSVANIAAQLYPSHLGNYTLVRSWNETSATGPIIYVWAQYAPLGVGTPITIGVSPELGWHDPYMCHFSRGEKPLWRGQLAIATASAAGVPINFNSAFYDDGVTRYVEASTMCRGGACGEFATERTHFAFVYTHPRPESLLSDDPAKPIPVVVRAETIDTTLPPDATRQQLTTDLRSFLASVKLDDLTRPYSH